jgi:hypothetical protein
MYHLLRLAEVCERPIEFFIFKAFSYWSSLLVDYLRLVSTRMLRGLISITIESITDLRTLHLNLESWIYFDRIRVVGGKHDLIVLYNEGLSQGRCKRLEFRQSHLMNCTKKRVNFFRLGSPKCSWKLRKIVFKNSVCKFDPKSQLVNKHRLRIKLINCKL